MTACDTPTGWLKVLREFAIAAGLGQEAAAPAEGGATQDGQRGRGCGGG